MPIAGREDTAQSGRFQRLRNLTIEMLACYRSRDWDGALEAIERGRKTDDAHALELLYDLYESADPRLSEKEVRRREDWNGAFALLTKRIMAHSAARAKEKRDMTRPSPKQVKAMADVAGVPVSAEGRRAHCQFHRPRVRRLCSRRRHAAVRSGARDICRGASRKGRKMSATEPALLSLTEVAQAIAQKQFSSREATQSCLDRIAQWQPRLNAFMAIEAEEALAAADRADAALAKGNVRGVLHGVPLAHKDMYYDDGKVVTCGSRIRRDFVATTTATALQRLKDAGTVRLGSLQMSEFAYGPTGHNSHYGPVHNPWAVDHITGGSSSGSGAAVAARLTFAALGSDTGGSVRMPAHFCGVTGLKTTVAVSAAPARCRCRSRSIPSGRWRARRRIAHFCWLDGRRRPR